MRIESFPETNKDKNILEILSYKSIPEKILKKEIVKIEETKDKEVLSYATNRNYIKDIADIIMDIEKLENCKKQIQKIIKDSKLPKRSDEIYEVIENYKPYELTHCISYEMAVRNQEIKLLLKNINIHIEKGEFVIDDVDMLANTIIMLLKGVLIKAKASNMGFDEAQQILTKHIIYLLDQCTRKI